MEPYWESNGHTAHPVKYETEAAVIGFPYCAESGLNFATSGAAYSEDDAEYASGRRGKPSRQDPLSHRIIEKRRRDRMNSCLADLSRLIPPQYQRKGRGRIEKTEIIEMAIRHLKHLQNECLHKEIEYKLGYSDCIKETAKFLYESHMQDVCYQLISHLQEHCDEIMKSECYKNRCTNVDTVSGSSDSPPATNYHPSAPLSHLRDMLTSDVEHSNSNDHTDLKDLTYRNQPHQTPVVTSTAPSSVHHDSSNNDFDSSHDHLTHSESATSSPPPLHHHLPNNIIQTGHIRNCTNLMHDIEHHNYKYKNHIKQRFNQDSHSHDDSANDHIISNPSTTSNEIHTMENIAQQTTDNVECKKRKMSNCDAVDSECCDDKATITTNTIKTELSFHRPKPAFTNSKHFSVPIFALHSHGTYYVPLSIDYDILIPYLHGTDLLDKNYCTLPPLHPVNINVHFSSHSSSRQNNFIRSKGEAIVNGW